jgi:hypothetical protein
LIGVQTSPAGQGAAQVVSPAGQVVQMSPVGQGAVQVVSPAGHGVQAKPVGQGAVQVVSPAGQGVQEKPAGQAPLPLPRPLLSAQPLSVPRPKRLERTRSKPARNTDGLKRCVNFIGIDPRSVVLTFPAP